MIAAGTQLGPYRIVAPLGSGAMGEVYRARDTRLGREVAVKVLPAAWASDPERLRRFEHEARAVGMLNHPNILALHDLGSHDGAPFLVFELLEGQTLRDRLDAGSLPVRKAIEYGVEIARGLAAAHQKSIVHRDLKPENLFITRDGHLKILDFGLAKLNPASDVLAGDAAGFSSVTETGAITGTAGYMSPEQLRGKPADTRSDLFTLGAILYEMLSGQRAFRGDSAVERLGAILNTEPPPLRELNRDISPQLERIVRHCLEKAPDERFQSARDVAFDLESLSISPVPEAGEPVAAGGRRRATLTLVAIAALLLAFTGGEEWGRRSATRQPPSFKMITFRRGTIQAARFTPDGQTIVYSARWQGQPVEMFACRPESPESRPLDLPGAEIFSISSAGEMAISLNTRVRESFIHSGTLARVPVAGGAPRELLEDVMAADWTPDGQDLVTVRDVNGKRRLEYPAGRVLYETDGWISHPRFAPNGARIAFLDHPVWGDDAGDVEIVDLGGHRTTLAPGWESIQGLAWSPRGNEVWFTASHSGVSRALFAVSLSAKLRPVESVTGELVLQDIARDGRVLITHDDLRTEILGVGASDLAERNLSWLDWSTLRDITPDGKQVLIAESGEGGGPGYGLYLRPTDNSAAVRLGEGEGMAISPDGRWVISVPQIHPPRQIVLLPTHAGAPRTVTRDSIDHQWACWLPDGSALAFTGNRPGRGVQLFVQSLAGGAARAISPEGVRIRPLAMSPDGASVAAVDQDGVIRIFPIAGGASRLVSGALPGELPIRWSAGSRSLLVSKLGELPVRVFRLELVSGRREPWRSLTPADPAGALSADQMVVTADGRYYAYNVTRMLSQLFIAQGLR